MGEQTYRVWRDDEPAKYAREIKAWGHVHACERAAELDHGDEPFTRAGYYVLQEGFPIRHVTVEVEMEPTFNGSADDTLEVVAKSKPDDQAETGRGG